MSLQQAIWRPSHRQTRAKSWQDPGENHSKHSEQPKRMNSKRRCGGIASAYSIRRTLTFSQGAKRSKYFAECRTPGELASPYPSTGLRESAAPHRPEIFVCDLKNPFCFWPPKSSPWPLLGSVRRLQHRSWAFLACFFAKNRSERAPKSDFR